MLQEAVKLDAGPSVCVNVASDVNEVAMCIHRDRSE